MITERQMIIDCWSLLSGHEDIINMLKEAGGDVKVKSAMGQRPGGKGHGLGSEFEISHPFF